MDELPGEVTEFLDRHITSVMALEVLLRLATTDRVWRPGELSASLGGSPDAVIRSLEELHGHRLVNRVSDDDLAYRYAPRDAEGDRAVASVAEAYARRKVAVVSRIFSLPADVGADRR
jgi:DNA-binding HxlR family transcriptional regulator